MLHKMKETDLELSEKLKRFEKEIEYVDSQLVAVEEGIKEMDFLDEGLEGLVGKEDEEIFAPIGRGIFVRAKILSEELLVDVGEKNFIKKSIPETREIVKEQNKKLKKIRGQLVDQMKKIDKELTRIIKEKSN